MAQQLRNALDAFYDESAWTRVQQESANWPGPHFNDPIADVHTFVLHETDSYPNRFTATKSFYLKFFGGAPTDPTGKPSQTKHPSGEMAQVCITGDGTVILGFQIDPAVLTSHAGFVNNRALGSETGHSWGNWSGNGRTGPYTSTNETVIGKDANGNDKIDGGLLAVPVRKLSNGWVGLSGKDSIKDETDDDLPGLKAWFRLDSDAVVTWWTTSRYHGPWRQEQRVPEMLFSEAQYRSWALLLRYVAEQYGIPRNFSLLPHKMRSSGFGTPHGLHGMETDYQSFRAIVNADDALSRSLATLGVTSAQMASDETIKAVYQGADHADVNSIWKQVFTVFRGFHGHGYSGDPVKKADHDCPGPMFDWHRLAREVWDWWWHPFDLAPDNSLNNVPQRPYTLKTRDGTTTLAEYWFSQPVADYNGLSTPGIHGATGSPATFALNSTTRIHALAAGELVAARFPPETGGVNLAFMVVRHEVFHGANPFAGVTLPGGPSAPPVAAGRLDYDTPPSTVYSLYMHLGRPDGIDFANFTDANPEWLNRVLMRAKEAELGVKFAATDQAATKKTVPQAVWDAAPPSTAGTRPTLLQGWTADNAAYTTFLTTLANGDLAVPPPGPQIMPIRILLGDYLGNAGVIHHDANTTQNGIRVEVFSRDFINTAPANQFMQTVTDATRRWDPAQGTGIPAVKYPSEWSIDPTPAEKAALQAAGVDRPELLSWWTDVQIATADPSLPADAHLDGGGMAVHYDPYEFMSWLNTLTWQSEWPKYHVTDPAGVPQAPKPRPRTLTP